MPSQRWYEVALAPPMAADELGRSSFGIADLMAELCWPEPVQNGRPVDVGLVETAGGLRSPLAADGDCLDLCTALAPDLVLLVADAGLGTINVVRLTADALAVLDVPVVVVLNRFDPAVVVHARNLHWLRDWTVCRSWSSRAKRPPWSSWFEVLSTKRQMPRPDHDLPRPDHD